VHYTIDVISKRRHQNAHVLQLLSGIEGLRVQRMGTHYVIEGTLLRAEDMKRVSQVAKTSKNIINETIIHAKALEAIGKTIKNIIHAKGMKQVKVTHAGNVIYLEGYVTNTLEKNKALNMASQIYFQTQDHLKLGVETQNKVWVDMKFLEIKKNKLEDVGVSWPDHITLNQNITGKVFKSTRSNLSTHTGLAINTLISNGHARMLSNPKILVRQGKRATFDAGGELPIRLISERTAQVQFKPYGLHIDIDIQTDDSDHLVLDVHSRMSDLDLSTTIEGLPAIVEHKVNTSVDLKYGDTIALAGLIEQRRSKGVKKFPFFGHIPVLGELFKSRQFRNNQSDFVMTITPYRADHFDSPHNQKFRDATQKNFDAMDETLDFSILD